MKDISMKRAPMLFLQAAVVAIGLGTLAFLLWEPHVEGVNANATSLSDIYLDDPFLAYAYISFIPFFIGLYQAFKLLANAGRNAFFVQDSVNALQTIKYCAMVSILFIAGGVTFLLSQESDDRPPIIMMGIITTFISIVIATAAGMSARVLQNAVDLKKEHDLTV